MSYRYEHDGVVLETLRPLTDEEVRARVTRYRPTTTHHPRPTTTGADREAAVALVAKWTEDDETLGRSERPADAAR